MAENEKNPNVDHVNENVNSDGANSDKVENDEYRVPEQVFSYPVQDEAEFPSVEEQVQGRLSAEDNDKADENKAEKKADKED